MIGLPGSKVVNTVRGRRKVTTFSNTTVTPVLGMMTVKTDDDDLAVLWREKANILFISVD